MTPELEWLFARQRFGIRPGLARVRALLARRNRPDAAFGVVLVGGTNGKGSTASTLESILRQGGLRTGLFTSPHLSRAAERFVVVGERVSTDALEAAARALRPDAEALDATFFEILTVLACELFAAAGVEVAVMEVGLGGRYDATNALEPALSVLTGVALDHTGILGDTVEAIAADKAHIFRRGRPALTGATGAALEVVRREARRIGAELRVLGEDFGVELRSSSWGGLRLAFRGLNGSPLELATPLLGAHQARNVGLAVAAARALGASDGAIVRGVAATRWPGRLEPLRYRERTVVLDGAHNPEAAAALARALAELGAARYALVLGASEDKDLAGIVGALEPGAGSLYLTRSSLSARAAPPERLRSLAGRGEVVPDPMAALVAALAVTPPAGLVLVAGSLYLVGELRALLLGEALEKLERWQ